VGQTIAGKSDFFGAVSGAVVHPEEMGKSERHLGAGSADIVKKNSSFFGVFVTFFNHLCLSK
jgi:hypothetical protein